MNKKITIVVEVETSEPVDNETFQEIIIRHVDKMLDSADLDIDDSLPPEVKVEDIE